MVADHDLVADDIKAVTLEMKLSGDVIPLTAISRNRRPPMADRFGRTGFMLAYTLANGDYPVLESNIEHAGDAGARC